MPKKPKSAAEINLKELYSPSKEVVDGAHIKDYESIYEESIQDPEKFWGKEAEGLDWYKKWDRVLDDSNKAFYKWFSGGKINIVHNAIERHLKTWRKNKIAMIWEGEPGDYKVMSYFGLNREVGKFATILKSMGVQKGDVVTIYMPQIPELLIAMLATAKLGAIHSVVYGGFSYEALAERIENAQSRVLVTADGGWRRGKITDLKVVANEAMKRSPSIEVCITVKRTGHDVVMDNARDFWYHDLLNFPMTGIKCETEITDAEDPLFILYTSGTTGKPKGLVHTHGGYALYTSTTHKYVFDIKDEDRWWCAADPGWITGHSYMVYGPLINGSTIMMYEGAPNYPYPNRWWSMIEKYGITHLYTSPTAIRGLMRYGDAWPKRHDLSSLRMLGSVGEPINPEAWKWFYTVIGEERCPIMDTWWQTETGGFMITPLPCVPLKPGSATRPFFGNEMDVVDEEGEPVKPGEVGKLVIQKPWPGMARTIHKDPDRYVEIYWKTYQKQGWYLSGDSAKKDKDGYFWIIGRIDDVIKVSGYRLGSAEIESALVSHPAVAEAACIGVPHEWKGEAIHAFVILKTGVAATAELSEELKDHVAAEVGKIAKPQVVEIVDSLPKTRSGKIVRRVLKAKVLGEEVGDISTLDD